MWLTFKGRSGPRAEPTGWLRSSPAFALSDSTAKSILQNPGVMSSGEVAGLELLGVGEGAQKHTYSKTEHLGISLRFLGLTNPRCFRLSET